MWRNTCFLLLLLVTSPFSALATTLSDPPQTLRELSGRLALSPGGRYLTSLNNGTIHIYDWQLNKVVKRLYKAPRGDEFNQIAYTPNGQFLVTGTRDGVYTLWPTWRHQPLHHFYNPKDSLMYAQPMAISPDSRYLAIGTLHNQNHGTQLAFYIQLWDMTQRRKAMNILVNRYPNTFPGHPPAIALDFHPLGRYLTAAMEPDEGASIRFIPWIQVFDFNSGTWAWWQQGTMPIRYSANGEYFLFASPVKHVKDNDWLWQYKLWHSRSNRLKTLPGVHDSPSNSVALSPNGAYAVLPGKEYLALFSTRTTQRLYAINMPDVQDKFFYFSGDSKRLFAAKPYDVMNNPIEIRDLNP